MFRASGFPALFIFVSAFCCPFSNSTRIQIHGRGYRNILIAISPQIPNDKLKPILSEIKGLFTQASEYLYRAIGRLAFFESIVVLIPQNLNVSDQIKKEFNISSENVIQKFGEADFQIEPSVEVPFIETSSPYTLQYGECGHPGRRVHVPLDFLLNRKLEKIYGYRHRVLVHEWAHYRYGVFDEYGFPGDDRYPPFFTIPYGEEFNPSEDIITATSCTLDRLTYTIWPNASACDPLKDTGRPPPTEECRLQFSPNMTKSSKSQYSIMFQQGYGNVIKFCGNEEHRADMPSKHNTFCKGQSTLEIIVSTPDFSNQKLTQAPKDKPDKPQFTFLQEVKVPNFMFAFDTGSSDQHTEAYANVLFKAWYDFIMMAPTGSLVSLVSFGSQNVTVFIHPIVLVGDLEERKRIAILDKVLRYGFQKNVDSSRTLGGTGAACVTCIFDPKLIQYYVRSIVD